MKKDSSIQLLLVAIFFIFSFVYYRIPVFLPQIDKVYITITTFFFSIFTGFFISQQVARYSKLREYISTFDGRICSVYRSVGNINKELQKEIKEIIKKHYKKMLLEQAWDYHFTHKSNTITRIHELFDEQLEGKECTPLQNHSISRTLNNLSDCEVARKNMILLHEERIPQFQWFVITFFVLVLIVAVSAIPSEGLLLESILKSAFGVSILSIVSILYHLDRLHLFEMFIGEKGVEDVLAILEGKK